MFYKSYFLRITLFIQVKKVKIVVTILKIIFKIMVLISKPFI